MYLLFMIQPFSYFYFIIRPFVLLMRGSKTTNKSVFLSKDGRQIMIKESERPIQYPDRNLILKGSMIRRKKPFKIHKTPIDHNRNKSSHQINQSSPNQQIQSSKMLLKKEGMKIQSKLSTYDILNYLQKKCSEVFFSTQNSFMDFYKKDHAPNLKGRTGVSLQRINSCHSNCIQQSTNSKDISSLQVNTKQGLDASKTPKIQVSSSNLVSKSHSPIKIRTVKKNYASSIVVKPTKTQNKLKRFNQLQTNADKSKTKPLLSYNHSDLKHIKSESCAMIQVGSQQLILINRGKLSLQIASITKIMTAYVVLNLSQKMKIDIKHQTVQVQQYVEKTTGTSAQLIHGDIYTLQQLLYGLLLPSGNDAALVLADWAGSLLNKQSQKARQYKQNVSTFVQEMTKTARDLGLKDTRYGNPHGLPHLEGRSTAYDQCKLAAICFKNSCFRQIVKTKYKKFQIVNSDGNKRQIIWQNTNKLLRRPGFLGLKTGITVTAGPCLISAYEFRQKIYILTVLRASKVSRRFKDTRKILYWALCKLYEGKTCYQQSLQLQELNKNKNQLDSDYSQDQNEFVYGQEGWGQYTRRKNILTNQL